MEMILNTPRVSVGASVLRVAARGLLSLSVTWAVVVAPPLHAQRYRLRDGRVLTAENVVVRGQQLVQTLSKEGSSGGAEMGLPLSSVIALDWPEPAELGKARADISAGRLDDARTAALAVIGQFAPFAAIPGSWWSEAELLRLRILLASGKGADVQAPAEKLVATTPSDDTKAAGELLLANCAIREKRFTDAGTLVNKVLARPSSRVEADAYVLLGDLRSAQLAWEGALEAYLHLPAFYPGRADLLPTALLGAARAYRGWGDSGRAERTTLELADRFPESAEAKAAQKELGL